VCRRYSPDIAVTYESCGRCVEVIHGGEWTQAARGTAGPATDRLCLASSISIVTFSSHCDTAWLTFKLPLKKSVFIML